MGLGRSEAGTASRVTKVIHPVGGLITALDSLHLILQQA
jgi:hypothetical protein